ncbi:hypothetical protein F5Y08DRAFT_172841 [Xylaria arbuscula]|nr:hypothetical protein F5Y08DRAFT_172841 [Xylaria arbuscula]
MRWKSRYGKARDGRIVILIPLAQLGSRAEAVGGRYHGCVVLGLVVVVVVVVAVGAKMLLLLMMMRTRGIGQTKEMSWRIRDAQDQIGPTSAMRAKVGSWSQVIKKINSAWTATRAWATKTLLSERSSSALSSSSSLITAPFRRNDPFLLFSPPTYSLLPAPRSPSFFPMSVLRLRVFLVLGFRLARDNRFRFPDNIHRIPEKHLIC